MPEPKTRKRVGHIVVTCPPAIVPAEDRRYDTVGGLFRHWKVSEEYLERSLNSAALLKRGLFLEYTTLAWNVVGVVLVLVAAYAARSVALAGFGLDSLIEIFASVVVVLAIDGH